MFSAVNDLFTVNDGYTRALGVDPKNKYKL